MENKYHTVGRVPKYNKNKCKKRQKRHPYHTKIQDRTLSWLDTSTSIKSSMGPKQTNTI
jgi:hypothetical protein